MRNARQTRCFFRFLLPVVLMAASAGLMQCSKKAAENGRFKVALLSPGPISDAGWNAAAYEGLMLIQKQLDAEISQIETKTPSEFEEAFRDYARRGFHLVFGHGFEFQDAAAAVAPDFPKTVFITTSGNTVRDNVSPMVFELEQATYLAGMLAALMSRTGKLGAVGGMEIPPVASTFAAFEAGAKAVNPQVQVLVSYIGNWEDVGAARQAALALIDRGCDFLIHNADAAAAGVLQAAAERDVYVFGTNKNQNHLDPQHVIASCVSHIPQAYVEMARIVQSGTFDPKIYRLGMKEGVVDFVINPELRDRIPAEIMAKIDEARQNILSGEIIVPSKQ
ncbi:MAG: BMP family protein [candidate division KSB1 bacterium]|nr:BMP family protein [candidate division KSB1 bacterium]MDQ7064034.1 BMP family protein [candidate division KSB1 bacterium]